jgi:hypothetical protein
MHLLEFLSQVDSIRLYTFAILIITSALALDAYPPKMHGKALASVNSTLC